MNKMVPPYILGLPQWPGTSQVPVSGQALAEWHADKTVQVGEDTFVEDVCGDYFPPNGLPAKSYVWNFNPSPNTANNIFTYPFLSNADVINIEICFKLTSPLYGDNQQRMFSTIARDGTPIPAISWCFNKLLKKVQIVSSSPDGGGTVLSPTLTLGNRYIARFYTPAQLPGYVSQTIIGLDDAVNDTTSITIDHDLREQPFACYGMAKTATTERFGNIVYYMKINGTEWYPYNTSTGVFYDTTSTLDIMVEGTLTDLLVENYDFPNPLNYIGYSIRPAVLPDNISWWTINGIETEVLEGDYIPFLATDPTKCACVKWNSETEEYEDNPALDYSGRTQFPIKTTIGGLTPAECYEMKALWLASNLSWPSSIGFANIVKDIENRHCLFFSRAEHFDTTDSALAYLSGRTTETNPTIAQAGGFLGL